jgi:hypothetical protein
MGDQRQYKDDEQRSHAAVVAPEYGKFARHRSVDVKLNARV